jgi:hypothetical protein
VSSYVIPALETLLIKGLAFAKPFYFIASLIESLTPATRISWL